MCYQQILKNAYMFVLLVFTQVGLAQPKTFVDLHKVAPDIRINMRYASDHNFVGRPIKGYNEPNCYLTRPTATALAKVEKVLLSQNLTLKVYDCYRPQRAVNDFIAWSKKPNDQSMKAEFYPRIDKKDFFKLGYAAKRSGHSRGSTVDLTIVPIKNQNKSTYKKGQKLIACYAPFAERFNDGSIDMGTGFDCMDKLSHPASKGVNASAYKNRLMLQTLMKMYGFKPLSTEWWHFTLENEPYPNTYFDFPVGRG